jgi:hypothetical protein
MKSKLIFGLLAMTLILAFASASFAQITLSINNAPSVAESVNKRTAQTADPTSNGAGLTVSGAVLANAQLTTTHLLLQFPGPITSSATVPGGDPLRIVGATGLFSAVSISTILYSSGVISLTLPECNPGDTTQCPAYPTLQSGSFRIVGARIDVNNLSAPLTVSATVDNGGNNYFAPTSPATLISALSVPIATPAAPSPVATVYTNGSIQTATSTLKLTEGYASAWRPTGNPGNASAAGFAGGSDQITLFVSGLVTGQTITVTSTNSATLSLTPPGGLSFTAANAATGLTWTIAGSSLSTVESITFTFTITAAGTAPVAPATISVTAQMSPIGGSVLSNSVPVATLGYPVYANTNAVGPITIASILPAQTTMLIPFATYGGGYDTGIAIANTTADPFGSTTGGATAQSGTITLDFYPQLSTGGAGTPSELTTSATIAPVTGLSADGTLAAGGSWTVLLSNLLKLATPPITGSFTGYVFIRANFLDGHGVFYPTNFSGFTAGSEILVLSPPISTPRVGTEQLNN